MDMAMLRDVGQDGISDVRGRLGDLQAFCLDWGRETGDARYLLLGDLLGQIDGWWEEQGVPSLLLKEVDKAMCDLLLAVLAEQDPREGSRLAGVLSERIQPLLVPTHIWVRINAERD